MKNKPTTDGLLRFKYWFKHVHFGATQKMRLREVKLSGKREGERSEKE